MSKRDTRWFSAMEKLAVLESAFRGIERAAMEGYLEEMNLNDSTFGGFAYLVRMARHDLRSYDDDDCPYELYDEYDVKELETAAKALRGVEKRKKEEAAELDQREAPTDQATSQ